MKEKQFNFVYLTTNLVNGKKYIGDHSTNNINDHYIGSGLLINKAIKKYKKEKFYKIILEQFNTKQEAFNAQEKYIIEYNTLEPHGYNLSPKGGHCVKESWSEKSKKKASKSAKGKKKSKEHCINIGKAKKGKTSHSKGKTYEELYGIKKTIQIKEKQNKKKIGKKQTKEQIKKRVNKLQGQKRNKQQIENISKSLKGKKKSEQHKLNISKAQIGLQAGNKNAMYGKSIYTVWVEKHGIEEADKKYSLWKENLKKAKHK